MEERYFTSFNRHVEQFCYTGAIECEETLSNLADIRAENHSGLSHN